MRSEANLGSEPIAFCELTHRLAFSASAGALPSVDEPIHLIRADVPYVATADGTRIGMLTDRMVSAVRQCLIEGFLLRGRVASFDPKQGRGEVEVRGAMG